MSLARRGDRTDGGQDRRLVLKAALDRLVAALLLLLTAVWLLLICAAIRLDSPGPVFAREPRVGRLGRQFRLLRFRTTMLGLAPEGAAPNQGGEETVRVRTATRVGRLLQRYSLDELPQLINVLRGEMSLVGPRPQDPRVMAEEEDGGRGPLPVKPGLTGLYGGDLRSDPGAAEQMDVDDYVRNYSLGLDLVILRRALRAGLSSGHAG